MTQESGVPDGFWGRVQRMIDDAIAKLARSGMLRNASITDGGLTIKNGTLRILYPDGSLAVYYGNIVSSTTGEYLGTGMLVQKPDGGDIASFSWDAADDTLTAHLHDDQNHTIVSNDKQNGFGLDRPWVPGVMAAARFQDFRYSTTSATFETLTAGFVPRQHSYVDVGYRVSADVAGTTGEVRVMANGLQVGPTSVEGFAVATRYTGLQVTSGAHMSQVLVEIQARRTAGTGAIKLEPTYFMGRGGT